ncbi:glycosyltransferase family 2 protein [Thomasclavelia cocleata]|uniref:glycosyltransferase family 2 protein n=1 Tax=Thomasclavelia cocleata TaxID=69824 RepID=UPI00258BA182|nr:glycosyltransferase family 2 protein [Thomasclavelia cocleata]
MADLTTIILTYNEEKNIANAINSVLSISKRIVVVDSYSTDKTVDIAKSLGADILQNPFENQAKQFIYALNILDIKTTWIMRLDADEIISKNAAKEIEELCLTNINTDINGIVVRFEVDFLGKKLRHGGIYPFRKMIVYKRDKGYMEDRAMDEHIVLSEGKSVELKHDSFHRDYKDLNVWIDKHNKYSSREVEDYFTCADKSENDIKLNKSAKIKRYIKLKIYYKLPLGTRAHLYYIYRYYFKLGFLDGKEGKIFAFMQAYWYRFLVDAKILEKNNNVNERKIT